MTRADVQDGLHVLGGVLPPSGVFFRTKDITETEAVRRIYAAHVSDTNFHARIAQEMSANRAALRLSVVGDRDERGVLWERL